MDFVHVKVNTACLRGGSNDKVSIRRGAVPMDQLRGGETIVEFLENERGGGNQGKMDAIIKLYL